MGRPQALVKATTMGKYGGVTCSIPKSLVEPIGGEKKNIAPWGFHHWKPTESVENDRIIWGDFNVVVCMNGVVGMEHVWQGGMCQV